MSEVNNIPPMPAENPPKPRRLSAAMKRKLSLTHLPEGEKVRIFIKGLNWVGDAVMSTPVIRLLRKTFKDAHITLMVRPWVAAIYEHNPDIDDLWVMDDSASSRSFLKAVRMVRKGNFHIGIALPNSIRSSLLLKMGGVRNRIGFKRGGRSLLLNRGVPLDPELLEIHQVYYYLGLLEPFCGKPGALAKLVLEPGELERAEIRRLLSQEGLDMGRPRMAIAPGSINSNAKRWPAERYAALIDHMGEKTDLDILLLGSSKEQDVLDRVESLCKTKVYNLGGKVSLSQVIALLELLQGMICNDAGSMHMAAAMHVPTVAVFGPTEYNTTYPFSPVAQLVRKGVECSPCMLRECPIDHRCMTGVTVEEVFATFKAMLKKARDMKESSRVRS